ncbi:MAG: hypothetical protein P1V97_03110, partial [Planctomycetota bacterium]|nr:hypothetical protein [Planctomycetota bacterium]
MKSRILGTAIGFGVIIGLTLFLWPKENGQSGQDRRETKKNSNSSRLKLMVKSKDSLKKKAQENGPAKKPKNDSRSSEKEDQKEILGQQLRDAVKNGTMSKTKAIQIWREKTGGRHPWEDQMKKWGKGKGKGAGKQKR